MPDLAASLRALIERSSSPVDVDAIVVARRRRRNRRRAVALSGLAVVVVGVIVGVVARPTGEPTQVSVGGGSAPAPATGLAASLAQVTIMSPGGGTSASSTFSSGTPIHLTDPRSGRTHSVPFPIPNVTQATWPFVVRGSSVVMLVDANTAGFGGRSQTLPFVYTVSSDFATWAATTNGEPGAIFPAAAATGVWTVSGAGSSGSVSGPGGSSYRLTRGRVPVAALDDGLLTQRPGPARASVIYEVWDPASGRAVRTLPMSAPPLAVSGSFVAWQPATCDARCDLHVTNTHTGADRAVAPPRGLHWFGPGAFAPDGMQLALAAVPSPTREEIAADQLTPFPGTRRVDIAVIDASTGAVHSRAVTAWNGALVPQWSPDGSVVFFVRDRTHVGYLDTTSPGTAVHELAVPDAPDYLVVAKPSPPSAAVARQRWSYQGLVGADQLHSPELCVYGTFADLSPYSSSCSGPLVVGMPAGPVSGKYALVGTYDGTTFTLTQPPSRHLLPVTTTTGVSSTSLPVPPATVPPTGLPSGCPTPAGGWRVTNPAKVSITTWNAVTSAAQAAPDYVSTWVGPYTSYPGVADPTLAVLNFAFTGNVDAHRRALSAIYGGPICVVQRGTNPEAELQAVEQQLFGAYGRSLGLQLISAGPAPFGDVLDVQAIAVTGAQRAAVDRRFGKGVVNLSSVLTPLP